MKLYGRKIYSGKITGEVLKTNQPISFFGGVDPETGEITEKGHELEGKKITAKIFVFPTGKGSTVGSYTLYRLKKNNKAPSAIINRKCDPVIAVGCIISEIPCIDQIDIEKMKTGSNVEIDGENATVDIKNH